MAAMSMISFDSQRTRGVLIFLVIILFSMSLFGIPALSHAQSADVSVTAAPQQGPQQTAVESPSCWGYMSGIDWNCVWKNIMSWLGSWFLTVGGAVLLVAGTVFDWFMKLLVVEFAKTIQDLQLMDGLKRGWTLMRDLMNIGIIGVFVFVAIMTILGSAEYGAKRLVARVLVVSVLINFSFLFSQVVIEGTNFVSAQFWRGMPASVQTQGTAQSFLKTFGMEDVWSESKRLTDNAAAESDSGWAAFFYGLLAGTFLLAIAAVLLYGAYVISVRALLLVLAMLTSALAFASFLLPRWSNQNFIGWDSWWSNLLKASLFGPLLMMFLWITMTIIDAAQVQAQGAGKAIGALADDPSKMTDPTVWGSMILLILGTGLLFVAIRTAGSFASSIGGFGATSFGLGASLAYGLRGAGVLGRFGIGRTAFGMNRRNDEAISSARVRLAQLENDLAGKRGGVTQRQVDRAASALNNLVKDSAVYNKLAKGSYDATKTALGSQLVKSLGAGGLIGGKAESASARAERIAKEAAKKAEKHSLSDGDKAKVQEHEEKTIALQRDAAQKQLSAAEKSLEAARATGQKHIDTQQEARKEIEKITSIAKEEIKNMGRAGASQGDIQKRIAERDSALKEQAHRIEAAHTSINAIEKDALAKAGIGDITKIRQAATIKDDEIKKVAKANVNAVSYAMTREAAARYAAGTFGSTGGDVANEARDLVKKSKKDHDKGHHILDALKKQMEHGNDGSDTKDGGTDHA